MTLESSTATVRPGEQLHLAGAGTPVLVRPLEPDDRQAYLAAVMSLSAVSRNRRFGGIKNELSDRELDRLTVLDHRSHEALLAIHPDTREVLAIGRYGDSGGGDSADLAVAVGEDWRRHGLASLLLRLLVGRATAAGFGVLRADTERDNRPAIALMRSLGFTTVRTDDHGVVTLGRSALGLPASRQRFRQAE